MQKQCLIERQPDGSRSLIEKMLPQHRREELLFRVFRQTQQIIDSEIASEVLRHAAKIESLRSVVQGVVSVILRYLQHVCSIERILSRVRV